MPKKELKINSFPGSVYYLNIKTHIRNAVSNLQFKIGAVE